MMRRLALAIAISALAIIGTTACVGPPIRYAAVKMPTEIPVAGVRSHLNNSHDSTGLYFPSSVDIVGALEPMARVSESGVLMNVAVHMTKWGVLCVGGVCFTKYVIEADRIVPSARKSPTPVGPAVRTAHAAPPIPSLVAGPALTGEGALMLDRPVAAGKEVLTLAAGTEVTLVQSISNPDGHWWYVKADGRGGWVKAERLHSK